MGDFELEALEKFAWDDLDADGLFSGVESADSQTIMSQRLRTASELHQQGILSSEEKMSFKTLALKNDADLANDLKQVQQKNLSKVERKHSLMNLKATLRKGSLQINGLAMQNMDLLDDNNFDGFADLIDGNDMNLDVFDFGDSMSAPSHSRQPSLTSNFGAPPSAHQQPPPHQHQQQQQQQQHPHPHQGNTRGPPTLAGAPRHQAFQHAMQLPPKQEPNGAAPMRGQPGQMAPSHHLQQQQQHHHHHAFAQQPHRGMSAAPGQPGHRQRMGSEQQRVAQHHPHNKPSGAPPHAGGSSMSGVVTAAAAASAARRNSLPHNQRPPAQQGRAQRSPSQIASLVAELVGQPPPEPFVIQMNTIDLDEGLDNFSAKEKKNERERRRRLQVSHGFNDLFNILRLPENTKMEKATVLITSIERIEKLQELASALKEDNKRLRAEAAKRGIKI